MDAGFGTAVLVGLATVITIILGAVLFLIGLVMWALHVPLFGGWHPAWLSFSGAVISMAAIVFSFKWEG